MEHLKEFDGLPLELYQWGHEAVSKIKSPEKRHKIAAELRVRIDKMWNDNWQLEEDKRINWILDNLEPASSMATRLEKEEKYNPHAFRKYLIFAIVLIVLGLGISGVSALYTLEGSDMIVNVMPGWYRGRYAGSGVAAGIALFLIGVRTLFLAFQTKKEQKEI